MPITKRRAAPAEPPELLDLPLDGGAETEPPPAAGPAGSGAGGGRDGPRPSRGRRQRQGLGGLWLVLLLAVPLGGLIAYLSRADPPAAALSADLLDFGEVRLGTSGAEQSLKISNRGEQALKLEPPAIDGEAAGDFRIDAGGCLGAGVAAGADCALRLTFTPADRGARRARLQVASNAPGEPGVVPLVGVAVAPELTVEPPALDFGRQAVGDASAPVTVRIANRGSAPLQLGRIELSGPATADFRLTDGCGSRLLPPGERCALRVVLTAREAGERHAELRIRSDAGAPVAVTLRGDAILRSPRLRTEPAELDFGPTTVTRISPGRPIILANDGDAPLVITALRFETGGRPAGGGDTAFEVTAETCTGAEVPAGGACEVGLRFRPIAEGAAGARLAIESNASSEPFRVSLAGSGTVPRAVIDPQRLSFGRVPIGTWSTPRTLRLTSAGSEPLEVGAVTVTGADAVSFTVRGCAGVTLAPGSNCSIEVAFEPRRAGPHRAGLRILHSGGGDQPLPLNGIGVAPR